jgi:hypothetical protein
MSIGCGFLGSTQKPFAALLGHDEHGGQEGRVQAHPRVGTSLASVNQRVLGLSREQSVTAVAQPAVVGQLGQR